MERLFLRRGRERLPGIDGLESILGGELVATQPLSAELGGELFDIDCMRAGLLGDSDLKEYGAGRMVRKSSEKQARRLIDVAAGSWESFELSGQPQDAGVFVGFDVVDCDDGAEACFSFGGKVADYAERMLTDTKPLNGLTLLNSTAISHIAELLNITGVSGGFSASADAGLQALVEAAYNVAERRCRHALVIGGGAKITPWYLLRHREQLSPWRNRGIHPVESASAVLISSDLAAAQGELLAWRRNFASGEKAFQEIFDHFLSSASYQGLAFPTQVIVAGGSLWSPSLDETLHLFMPEACLCDLACSVTRVLPPDCTPLILACCY